MHIHCLDFGLNPIRKCNSCDELWMADDFCKWSNGLSYQIPVIPK